MKNKIRVFIIKFITVFAVYCLLGVFDVIISNVYTIYTFIIGIISVTWLVLFAIANSTPTRKSS